MNRKLWGNLMSVGGVHALNYIMPVITLPFLARLLGPAHWGSLAFAEAYAAYLSVFIEYGFGLSATREIAPVRDNPAARSRLLAGVIGAQGLLIVFATAVTLALSYRCSLFVAYRPLLPYALLLAAWRALNPAWYFQGLENMRPIAAITFLTNIAAAAGMLLWVRTPGDYWIPLMLRASAALIAAVVGFAIAYRDTPFCVPMLADISRALRQGWSLFVFKGAVSIFTTANVVLLGLLAPAGVVALFAGAEKIANAAASSVVPIGQVLFPRISYLLSNDRAHATRTARLSLALTVGAELVVSAMLLFGAPWLVRALLGAHFAGAVPVLRMLSALPVLMAVNSVLGVQWMLPLRLDHQFNSIIAAAGVVNILLALILVPMHAQMGMAGAVLIAEIAVTAGIVFILRRHRLDPWSIEIQEAELAA